MRVSGLPSSVNTVVHILPGDFLLTTGQTPCTVSTMHSVTAQNWVAKVAAAGIRLEAVALATGKSYSTVYRYSRWPEPTVGRRPHQDWLDQVARMLEDVRR